MSHDEEIYSYNGFDFSFAICIWATAAGKRKYSIKRGKIKE